MGVTRRRATVLPQTLCADPWHLVRFEGGIRLCYLTKLFGGGIVPGPANGGRGYIVDDEGELVSEHPEPVVFNQAELLYAWRNRPSAVQLEKAKRRELLDA